MQTAMSSALVRPSDAQRELARREQARRHLVSFSEYVAPNYYRAAAHHRLIAEYLELVETFVRTKGKSGIGRLLVLCPPRHGKSEQVSRHFPAWVLGRMPDTRVILASYGADLATKHSRAAREIVKGDRYQTVFGGLATVDAPVQLSADSQSVEAWDLAAPHRGGMVAAGVGGAITGTGANILIVDDPVKNRAEADSETAREKVWEWWTSTAYTRLEDGAAVIGMLTRWHGDDWAGRLLKAQASDPKADQWVVVCLPALWGEPVIPDGKTFEEAQHEAMLEGVWIEREDPLGRRDGQALWPQKYNEDDLQRIRVNVGPYDFEALYQQQPYLRSGNMFRRDWFPVVNEPPKGDDIVAQVRFWDKAGTSGGGKRTAGVLMALTSGGLVFVLHVEKGQWSSYEREQTILKTAMADRQRPGPRVSIWHEQEPGSSGKDSAEATNRMLAKAGFYARFETPTGDKVTRAEPWSSLAQGGGVRLVLGGWNREYIEEHAAFPKGNFLDQVDASSGALSKLMRRTLKPVRSYQG